MTSAISPDFLARAEKRLSSLSAVARARVLRLLTAASTGLPFRQADVLSEREKAVTLGWMNSEAFADRTREFSFTATNAAGERGEYKGTINGLLLIEPSYDAAKRAIVDKLAELERAGIITRTAPVVPTPPTFSLTGPWEQMLRDGLTVPFAPDTRLQTGFWADFPPYGGRSNDHLEVSNVALGFVGRSSGPILPNFPLPQQWKRYWPGPNFYAHQGPLRGGNGEQGWTFGDDAFVNTLDYLVTQVVLLTKGANGNAEWHPAIMAFNNGTQFPSASYPPDIQHVAFDDVYWRYQWKRDVKFAQPTRGARGSATGMTLPGRTHATWLQSMRWRQKVARTENHQLIATHDWGVIEAADAVADFMRWVNCASFMVEVGATSHVHACCECHNAVVTKAMREMGYPVGSDLEAQVARERAARGLRQKTREQQLDETIAQLQLAADTERAAAEEAVGEILRGGLVASAQLFMANPIAGGVCAVLVAAAAAMVYIFGGGLAERTTPEKCLVRDGRDRVRSEDEGGDAAGDVFGGNYYPWSREEAIRGMPVLRAKDAAGRNYE